MAKPKAEEKPDDLEIASIGSIYRGVWDKKYWSSSRGKDRYPYPVGYRAVRAHSGSTFTLEIQEGSKGPLFSIISAEGQSCSGQTPEIAWDKFQKRYFPRMKIWHGKRFSGKIDGVEFFGFKNPFVQRLLRELATNLNRTAERSSLPPNICNEASTVDNRSPEACPCLEISRVTGKRSRRRESVNLKSLSLASIKRTRPEDLASLSEASNSIKGNKRCHTNGNSMSSKEEASDMLAKGGIILDSGGFSNHVSKDAAVPQEQQLFVGSGAGNFSEDERKSLYRCQDAQVEEVDFPMAPEGENVDCQGRTDVDLYAPDTLDFTQGNDKTSEYAPLIQETSAFNVIISEGLLTDSHPEEETATSKSNASSEMSDFDSVGQEMAKSMMTFLLPQAIPLLKKGLKNKKGSVSPSEILPCTVKPQAELNETTAPSPGVNLALNKDAKAEKMQTQYTDLGSNIPTKCIVPDSLDDDQYSNHVVNHMITFSGKAQADKDSSDDSHILNSCGPFVADSEHEKSLDVHVETSRIRDVFSYKEVHVGSTGKLQECDAYISYSLPVCTSEEIKEQSANMDGCTVGVTIRFKEDNETPVDLTDGKNAVDDNERSKPSSSKTSQNEHALKTVVSETGNESFTQIPKLVYTRRKVQAISTMRENNSCLVAENAICRKNGDICVPEATGTFLALETVHLGSSDDNSNKKESVGTETRIMGQSSYLSGEKPSVYSEDLSKSSSAVLHDQPLVDSSKQKDMHSHDLSVSRLENHVDKDVVGHENLSGLKDSKTSQKQETNSIYDPDSVPSCSDLKPQSIEPGNKLAGILDIVGCYSHPYPVLSVLLSVKGSEIYICVLCGLATDKDGSLFMYKVVIEEPRTGHPCFVGHTSVTLPIRKDYFGRVALERSSLEFTPDGQSLVLLGSIRMPYCSQGSVHCLCSICASNCSEENALKIVQVKLGYVSTVARLKAADSLECILVCEPNFLVAVGESGRLQLWVMNLTWSAHMENFIMPTEDCISPGIVELRRIPHCTHLVLGHNGSGEFSLWDISKRVFVSRFSSSSASISQFFPVSLFTWKTKFPFSTYSDMEEHAKQMTATRFDHQFLLEGEDTAVCILVSSSSDSDTQDDYLSVDCHADQVGRWRLALLVKNIVIFGRALDPRAAIVGALAGQGICSTCDGDVYMWELCTGTKLGALNHFKGGRISCIATDDSGAIAVAADNQLLVYLHSPKSSLK